MIKFKQFGLFLAMVLVLIASSCEENESPIPSGGTGEPLTVYETIDSRSNTNAIIAALSAANGDLPQTLNGAGPFTVFAPTDAAFNDMAGKLGLDDANALLDAAGPELLSQILTYHVVSGANPSSSLQNGQSIATVQGESIGVETGDGVSLTDATELSETSTAASVIEADVTAINGVVHFIDKVLIPEVAITALAIDIRPNVVELAAATENLSVLVQALQKTELLETVQDLENITVFAPTNQAFIDLLGALGDDYSSIDDFDNEVELALLSNILLYHVLPERVISTELAAGDVETSLEGNTLAITAAGSGFELGDASPANAGIVSVDIDGTNGTVHTIDKVLLPQEALDFISLLAADDLATIVVATPTLSILEEALLATDLVGVFTDETNESFVQGDDESDEDFEARRAPENFTYYRPATVFAPSDQAFLDLLNLLGPDYSAISDFDSDEELALLKDILLYHVVEGSIASADLEESEVATQLTDNTIDIIRVVGTESFTIGDASNDLNAKLTLTDVMARNGVAHVIDKVLLPQSALDFINAIE